MDDFPYKKYYITPEQVNTIFENLQKYTPSLTKKNYKIYNIPDLTYIEKCYLPEQAQIILKCGQSDYNTYNIIGDYFTEQCRMKAKRYDQDLSPFDYWQQNKQKVKDYALEKYSDQPLKFGLRESLYNLISEATSFRPTVAISMIKEFNGTRILDFSSGWGDRLIGAMAADVEYYCGVDPNPCLQQGYKQIINTFSKKSKTKVNMICSGIETVEFTTDDKFDMILTSPPYFNLEVYSDDKNQSIDKNKTLDDWYNNFLIFSIKKVWQLLNNNGVMVLIINDIRNKDYYVKNMINDINKFTDSLYLGLISYAELVNDKPNSPQPMWIWRKVNDLGNIQPVKVFDNNITIVYDQNFRTNNKDQSKNQNNKAKEDPKTKQDNKKVVNLAKQCKLLQKKLIIYTNNITDFIYKARMYGAEIVFIPKPLNTIKQTVSDFIKQNPGYNVL